MRDIAAIHAVPETSYNPTPDQLSYAIAAHLAQRVRDGVAQWDRLKSGERVKLMRSQRWIDKLIVYAAIGGEKPS